MIKRPPGAVGLAARLFYLNEIRYEIAQGFTAEKTLLIGQVEDPIATKHYVLRTTQITKVKSQKFPSP
jgi:hypothetical protein